MVRLLGTHRGSGVHAPEARLRLHGGDGGPAVPAVYGAADPKGPGAGFMGWVDPPGFWDPRGWLGVEGLAGVG